VQHPLPPLSHPIPSYPAVSYPILHLLILLSCTFIPRLILSPVLSSVLQSSPFASLKVLTSPSWRSVCSTSLYCSLDFTPCCSFPCVSNLQDVHLSHTHIEVYRLSLSSSTSSSRPSFPPISPLISHTFLPPFPPPFPL
jgi:hypothetical protein